MNFYLNIHSVNMDNDLYHIQVKSQGKIGYVTNKAAPKASVHQSLRVRKPCHGQPSMFSYHIILNDEGHTSSVDESNDTISTDTESESMESMFQHHHNQVIGEQL